MEKKIVLNPEYILRNDVKRVIFTATKLGGITTFIHPLHAMILSFFDTSSYYSENIMRISETLKLKEEEVRGFTDKLMNNLEKVWVGEINNSCHFPERVLIEEPENYSERKYHFRDFIMDGNNIDISSRRNYIPSDAILMINTLCYTNCIYCYADRSKKFDMKISFERLCEIIDEAKDLKFRDFAISGGEFFLYKNWEKLLEKMVSCGFNPSIPTKIPLTTEQIKKIKDIGLKQIQISLDSINSETLTKLLRVNPDYLQKIYTTFKELENIGLNFRVNSIITSLNCKYNEIDNLIKFLLQYKNFNEISIGIVGPSLYKSDNQNKILKPNMENYEQIMKNLTVKYKGNEKVKLSGGRFVENNNRFTEDEFFDKANCSGNMQAFVILPDGKVTICEELYWQPKFIIGDLTKQSIMEMWNSNEALELYNIDINTINKKSACKMCKNLNYCHLSGEKCWRDILKIYGKENWDYPDPRCPSSPEPIKELFM